MGTLASITIPAGVTSIGERAFYNTAWLNSQPDGLVYAGKVLYTYKGTMPANTVINNIREDTIAIAGWAFEGYTNLTRITISGSVTSLGRYAFSGCTSLASITIPSSVISIGEKTFSGCTSLTRITIPSSVTSIGFRAFDGCTSLTSITIPPSVTSMRWNVFSRWTNQQTINIEGHASQAAADEAWRSSWWRDDCRATINYLGK